MPSAADVWKHFDWRYNRLAKLKILAANKEMRKEIERETRLIYQKNARNLNSAINIIQILDMELRKIDEWANTNYLIYCDLWKLKGNEKSATFVRAIYGTIRRLISSRGSAVVAHTDRLARRTGNSDARQHTESFKNRVKALDAEWRNKIEIEALEIETRQGQDRGQSFGQVSREPSRALSELNEHSPGEPVFKAGSIEQAPSAPEPAGTTATWDAIEISFLSDNRVQIRNGASLETLNYAEFGFEDGRSRKPNRAWETLRELAEGRGVIRDAAKTGRTWPKVEKRMQEIRKVLRKHFHISADPVPFVAGTGYQALFKISCRPSYHT